MATPTQGFLRPTTTPTPDELFDIWLPRLSAVQRDGDGAWTLTIWLGNRYAYEWVRCRMHKVIQRMVDTMLGAHASITYTAPHLEAAGQTA